MSSKSKGAAKERAFAKVTGGERTWWRDDVDVMAHGVPWEVKYRTTGLAPLYAFFAQMKGYGPDHRHLAVKAPRKPWLVVMSYEDWRDLYADRS